MTICQSSVLASSVLCSKLRDSIVPSRVLVVVVALLIREALSADSITNSQGLVAYTLLLLGYLCVEIGNLWSRENRLFWLNPVVLASAFTFALPFGVTNVLFFLPEDVISLVGLEPIATPWMNQLMLLVILGACAMWVGYSSAAGRDLGRAIARACVFRRWLRSSLRVNNLAVYSCLAISLAARILAIKLGVYGYSSTYEELVAAAQYSQYLAMAQSLGQLALVVLAIQCFASPRPSRSDITILWLVVAYEMVFGFLSGFKSAVVMPFVIVGVVHYSQRNRFPKWLVPAVVIAVIAAYLVIEPFRVARNVDPGFSGRSVGDLAATMVSAYGAGADAVEEPASIFLAFVARHNVTYIGSLGIGYAATTELPPDSPRFLGDVILAPLHAVIPRYLWSSKPLQNIGLWYTNQVMGLDIYSSTGMSPFTYLNFAGGPLAVVLGFLAVGILQRGLFDGLRCFGTGGLVALLGLLGTLSNIDSAFNTFFVGIIRFLPILVVAQYFLLRHSRPAE